MQAFTIGDLFLQKTITALAAVPGRDEVVAVVRSADRERDTYDAHLWRCSTTGAAPRQLTHGPSRDSEPRWSPAADRLAFIRTAAAGEPELHVIAAEEGSEASCVAATRGIVAHRWLADGGGHLVSLRLAVDPERRGGRGPAPPMRRPSAPELAWRLPYKEDGSGYTLASETHLFHLDPATGLRRQLTDGAFDVHGFEPSPDARRVAYVRYREGRLARRTDLWLCDLDGRHHRRLTHEFAAVLHPTWSPDGRRLAFVVTAAEGEAQDWLHVLDVATGASRPIAADMLELAAVAEPLHWSADGTRLIAARAHAGCHQLVSVDVDDATLAVLVAGDRQFGAVTCTRGHLVYSVESPVAPNEVFATAMDSGEPERPLTDLNGWWAERTPLEMLRRPFDVPDGAGGQERIEGWLIRALGAARPQPLLDDVHGGPAAYALLGFDSNIFWQVLCAAGWAVLALNPVGSASYGRAFCDRLVARWGELDLPQHLAAIRQLQDDGEADERVAISGKSYGGFLGAWAVGHTEVYRAAVVMAPVGNLESHHGTSDGGWYTDPLYLGDTQGFDRDRARDLSPVRAIGRATTPTLFLQGKDDQRCPRGQSEELFVELCRAGTTPAELVLYPGADHHFLEQGKPDCRVDAAERIVDWLRRHVGTPS